MTDLEARVESWPSLRFAGSVTGSEGDYFANKFMATGVNFIDSSMSAIDVQVASTKRC
jgi:hypothetical protein